MPSPPMKLSPHRRAPSHHHAVRVGQLSGPTRLGRGAVEAEQGGEVRSRAVEEEDGGDRDDCEEEQQ
jgi:hypothetical protein